MIYNLPLKIASVTSKSLWHLSERPYILDGIYIISSDRSLTNPLIFSMLEGSHTLRNRGRHRNTEERDSALNQRQQAGRQRGASLLDELLNEGPTPTRWENSAEYHRDTDTQFHTTYHVSSLHSKPHFYLVCTSHFIADLYSCAVLVIFADLKYLILFFLKKSIRTSDSEISLSLTTIHSTGHWRRCRCSLYSDKCRNLITVPSEHHNSLNKKHPQLRVRGSVNFC